MSKRKAAQAARQNIQAQLTEGTSIPKTASPAKKSACLKIQLHRVKQEPLDVDEEPQYTWQNSPLADEEEEEQDNNGAEMSGDTEDDNDEDSMAPTSSSPPIQNNPPPIVPMKISMPTKPAQEEISVAKKPKTNTTTEPGAKKPKTNIPTAPGNMKVKVIRACPKCTPIVMELAEQANKASKSSQELKRLMEDATRNVEKVKLILDDTFKKNKRLEEQLSIMANSSRPLPDRIMKSDALMRMYCGVNMCNQFKWLADKATQKLTDADVMKLKPIFRMTYAEQILAVLMFIRGNPNVEELSHTFSFRFDEEEFWQMFPVWLAVLYGELKPRIIKPPNYILNTNFPRCFQSMGRNLQAVIHKFEIVREKSAVFEPWQTSHCLKCIVVMSPKGAVMGISQVVDQSVPDTDLFTGSELDKLFCVANIVIDTQKIGLPEVLSFGIKVVEPPYDLELEEEAVSHIEVIVKKFLDFRILQGPIMRTVTKTMMDMVVTVCSGLLNLHEESFAYEPSNKGTTDNSLYGSLPMLE